MKKLILTLAFIYSGMLTAQVGIGTTSPDSSSVLDITSTSQGVLLPRVTSFPVSPATGLIVYRSDLNGFYAWNGTAWTQAVFGAATATTVGNTVAGNTISTTVNGVTGAAETLPNIYTADGTLTGNRTVAQGANTLSYTGTAVNAFSIDGATFSIDAQNNSVGIGSTAPDGNAALDVSSTSKGVLVPRVAIDNLLLPAPLSAPIAEGMLVFSSGGLVANGFYYWNGNRWSSIGKKPKRYYSPNSSGGNIPADADFYGLFDGDWTSPVTLPDGAESNIALRQNELLTIYKASGYDMVINTANTDLPSSLYVTGYKSIVFMFDGGRWVYLKTSN